MSLRAVRDSPYLLGFKKMLLVPPLTIKFSFSKGPTTRASVSPFRVRSRKKSVSVNV